GEELLSPLPSICAKALSEVSPRERKLGRILRSEQLGHVLLVLRDASLGERDAEPPGQLPRDRKGVEPIPVGGRRQVGRGLRPNYGQRLVVRLVITVPMNFRYVLVLVLEEPGAPSRQIRWLETFRHRLDTGNLRLGQRPPGVRELAVSGRERPQR